jgi:hypothetical protein
MESQSNVISQEQENPLVFSLGLPKQLPQQERRKRRIKKQLEVVNESEKKKRKKVFKKKSSKVGKTPNFPPWFLKYFKQLTEENLFLKTPIFNIFSSNTHLSSCIPSIEQQKWVIEEWSTPPFGKAADWDGSTFWSLQIVDELKTNIFNCNRLRGIFRRFLNRWRYSRFQKANEEDLFTCEVPTYPVYIVDWPTKQKWVFEAQSVMKDITNRLLHHDGCFEDPKAPRNPYTNLPLTASQTISCYSQLTRYPVLASFPFTAYRASRMNLNNFHYEHRIYLSLYALRKTFDDISFYETCEKMLDFIEMAFDRQNTEVNIDAYENAIKRFPHLDQLHKWKHFALKYYELEIKYADFDTARAKAHDKLFIQTIPLLQQQKEITDLYQPRPRVQVTFAQIIDANPFLHDLIHENNLSVTVLQDILYTIDEV